MYPLKDRTAISLKGSKPSFTEAPTSISYADIVLTPKRPFRLVHFWANRAVTAFLVSKGSADAGLFSAGLSISSENPIPEEMDHREILVRMPVMNKVQFLLAPEPRKPLEPRSFYVVFLVEKNVRIE